MTEVPEINLKIETVEIKKPSQYMGWLCALCSQFHTGKNKGAKVCVQCGASDDADPPRDASPAQQVSKPGEAPQEEAASRPPNDRQLGQRAQEG